MKPEYLLAGVMLVGLVVYVLGGGADFGGGVWDLFASGPRKSAQRGLIERAIGPIWEANHVWFIFVFVLLFSAFPPAFAEITTSLFGPLSLYAVGLVLRGAAFSFRHYAARPSQKETMGRLFSIASVVCPFLLGAMGALLVREGPLRGDLAAFGDPFVLASGVFVVALVAALAATYLTVEAEGDRALQEDFRLRALAALVTAGLASWVALLVSRGSAPALFDAVGVKGGAALTTMLGLLALGTLTVRRFRLARVAAAGLAASVVLSWGTAKGGLLAPPSFSIAATKAHPGTLQVLLVATGLGALVLVPSLVFLFRVFGGPRQEDVR